MALEPSPVSDIKGARAGPLGDSGDHRPHQPGRPDRRHPAAQYLDRTVSPARLQLATAAVAANHEVMIRGTFANIRLQNQLLDGVSGGYTRDFTQDGGPQAFIYDASQNYQKAGIPLVVPAARSTAPGSRATGRPRARCCWASRSSPSRSSASTAPTSSAWASSRCSSRPANPPSRWV